jgi:hypothetical protein
LNHSNDEQLVQNFDSDLESSRCDPFGLWLAVVLPADRLSRYRHYLRSPGSTTPSQTYPTAINPTEAIAGFYEDTNFVFHGFLWVSGTATGFDRDPSSAYTVATGT